MNKSELCLYVAVGLITSGLVITIVEIITNGWAVLWHTMVFVLSGLCIVMIGSVLSRYELELPLRERGTQN